MDEKSNTNINIIGCGNSSRIEPNGGKDENCAVVHLTDDTYAGQWYDNPCTVAHHYICERY